MANRWWIYQRERFPVLAHGLLIAAFSFSAVSYSTLRRGQVTPPGWPAILVAYVTSFLFFFGLRIADEFKDFEEDSRFRPYRAVPRGLVTLRELGLVGFGCAGIQLALALWLQPSLALLLVVVWIYLALMTREFFVPAWLKAHPVPYLISHMVILPLVDLYATACDWWPTTGTPPSGLVWFLVVSYFNGIVIEIGRKIRAPQDEETGVNTYSALWGYRTAVIVWLGAVAVTAAWALTTAYQIDFSLPAAGLLSLLLGAASWIAYRFVREPTPLRAKRIESLSGIWTILMYLSLGAVPLLWRWFAARRGA
jgi:4-hydroxybenzoate polyprenyltransferase